jgi:hypothetical protein
VKEGRRLGTRCDPKLIVSTDDEGGIHLELDETCKCRDKAR